MAPTVDVEGRNWLVHLNQLVKISSEVDQEHIEVDQERIEKVAS
jgi:hypothetical protein